MYLFQASPRTPSSYYAEYHDGTHLACVRNAHGAGEPVTPQPYHPTAAALPRRKQAPQWRQLAPQWRHDESCPRVFVSYSDGSFFASPLCSLDVRTGALRTTCLRCIVNSSVPNYQQRCQLPGWAGDARSKNNDSR